MGCLLHEVDKLHILLIILIKHNTRGKNDYKYRKCDKETSNYVKNLMMKLSRLQGFEKNVALADTDFCTVGLCRKI